MSATDNFHSKPRAQAASIALLGDLQEEVPGVGGKKEDGGRKMEDGERRKTQ